MEFPDLNITDFDNKTTSVIRRPKEEDFENLEKMLDGWKPDSSISFRGPVRSFSRVEYKSKYGLVVVEYRRISNNEEVIDTKKAELIVIKHFSYHPTSYTVH